MSPYEDWAGFAAWAADPGEGNACDERLLRASAANESR
jgi:hypothetical protein